MSLDNALRLNSFLVCDVFFLDPAEVWLESPAIYPGVVDLPIHVQQLVSAWVPYNELGVPKTYLYCLLFVLLAELRSFLFHWPRHEVTYYLLKDLFQCVYDEASYLAVTGDVFYDCPVMGCLSFLL